MTHSMIRIFIPYLLESVNMVKNCSILHLTNKIKSLVNLCILVMLHHTCLKPIFLYQCSYILKITPQKSNIKGAFPSRRSWDISKNTYNVESLDSLNYPILSCSSSVYTYKCQETFLKKN